MRPKIAIQGPWSDLFLKQLQDIAQPDGVLNYTQLSEIGESHRKHLEVLITGSKQSLTQDTLRDFPALTHHLRAASGDENVDLQALEARGIHHRHFPEPYAPSTAQHAVMLSLACLGNLSRWTKLIQSGDWARPQDAIRELSDVTIGLVGLGHVGTRVFALLKALGAKLWVSDPFQESTVFKTPSQLPIHPSNFSDFDSHLGQSDVLIFCARGKQGSSLSSFPILRRQHLSLLKQGVHIVNTSRAEVLEEAAIREGLETEVVGTCAFDVLWEEPLPNEHWLHAHPEKMLITPHIGSRSKASKIRMEKALLSVLKNIYA